MLDGMPERYVTTDYTSFEGSFVSEFMKNVEFIMYSHMTSHLPESHVFMALMREQLRVNTIEYKGFTANVRSTRMSGEMNTSLGNSFSNLILFSWMCDSQGIKYKGVVEGDDGLFAVSDYPNFNLIANVGFTIKQEKHDNIGDASFCGQVFDAESKQLIRDAVSTVISMGWSSSQYKLSNHFKLQQLEKARAMSFMYDNPGCPILNVYCRKILSMTRHIDISSLLDKMGDNYQREKYATASKHELRFEEPSLHTRLLYERRYGVTIAEQKFIENQIETNLGESRDISYLLMFAGKASITMWERYVDQGDSIREKKLFSGYRPIS